MALKADSVSIGVAPKIRSAVATSLFQNQKLRRFVRSGSEISADGSGGLETHDLISRDEIVVGDYETVEIAGRNLRRSLH